LGEEEREADVSHRESKTADSIASTDEIQMSALNGTESVQATVSHQLFEGLLTTYYIPLEIWYIRTIIEKACFPNSLYLSF
jgi:hypothetical protein